MIIRLITFGVIGSLISFFGLVQCQSAKIKLQKTVPFSVTDSYYQDWMGGQPGNSGTTVQLFVTTNDEIQPDSLYFQNRATYIDIKPTDKETLWVANFRKVVRRDINLTENPRGEYGNPVPEMMNFPFDLNKDEAILRYTKGDKVFYYKIMGIPQKETIFFPSAKPRN